VGDKPEGASEVSGAEICLMIHPRGAEIDDESFAIKLSWCR
jgi:hypothetical protein